MKPVYVSELMSPDPIVLRPDDRIGDALREMTRSLIHHLPVVDHNGQLAGLVSQRDLLHASRNLAERVGDVMQRDVKTISPDTLAHEAAYLILHHAIGSVPVTDDHNRLLGIVTVTDFVRVAYAFLGGKVPLDELEKEEEEAQRL